MEGVCGEDTPSKGAHNFRLPDGTLADIDYGKPSWEMGGYGGPNSKLTKWHLAWRPALDKCLFSVSECGLTRPAVVAKSASIRRRG